MNEPAVALTDFVLAAACAAFAWGSARRRGSRALLDPAVLLFAGMAAGALFGGIHHAGWGQGSNPTFWQLSVASLGATAFGCWWLAAGLVWRPRLRRIAAVAGAFGLALYQLYVWVEIRSFAVVAATTAPPALFLLGALTRRAVLGDPAARQGAIGMAVSVLGAVLQALRVGFGLHFDHNAVYHVLQLAAASLLFTSVAALATREKEPR